MVTIRDTNLEKETAYSFYTNLDITYEATMHKGYPKKVQLDPFKVKHIKLITQFESNEAAYYRRLADVVNELCDIDVYDLTTMDFIFILLYLRINSCGDTASYRLTCDKCDGSFPFNVLLQKLPIESIDDFNEIQPLSGDYHTTIPRVGTWIEMLEHQSEIDLDADAVYIAEGNTFEEKLEIFDNLEAKDLKTISEFKKSLTGLGVDASWKVTCPNYVITDKETGKLKECLSNVESSEKCGEETKVRIPFRESFFLPE